jgi:hypothetical protein
MVVSCCFIVCSSVLYDLFIIFCCRKSIADENSHLLPLTETGWLPILGSESHFCQQIGCCGFYSRLGPRPLRTVHTETGWLPILGSESHFCQQIGCCGFYSRLGPRPLRTVHTGSQKRKNRSSISPKKGVQNTFGGKTKSRAFTSSSRNGRDNFHLFVCVMDTHSHRQKAEKSIWQWNILILDR